MLLSTARAGPNQIQADQNRREQPMIRRDISEVLKDHDHELMAVSGVVGVYVGLLPDGESPCLKVMVVKETEDLKKRIPTSLEGYSVLIEQSGVIRPRPDNIP
jgi:hypothetical protein